MTGVMTSQAVIGQLNWRYAVKKFDAMRTIPADQWSALEQALVLAPSSFGLQPWKFVVVTDRAVREKLVAHSWSQRQVADASHLVVFAVRKGIGPADADRLVARMAEVRHVTKESLEPYRQMMLGTLSNPPKITPPFFSNFLVSVDASSDPTPKPSIEPPCAMDFSTPPNLMKCS